MVDWVTLILLVISLILLIGIIVTARLYSVKRKQKGLLYSFGLLGFLALFVQSLMPFLKIEAIAEDADINIITIGNVIILTKMLLALVGYILLVIAFNEYAKNGKKK